MKRHGYLTPFLAVCILLTQLGHCPPGLNAGADIWTTSGPVLGAVYDLAVGSEQGTAYAAIFDQKAVFRTTDYGASWQRLDSGISEGDAIHSVAVAGGTGDVLYALGFSTV